MCTHASLVAIHRYTHVTGLLKVDYEMFLPRQDGISVYLPFPALGKCWQYSTLMLCKTKHGVCQAKWIQRCLSLINHLHVYDYKNTWEWSYQIQSARRHFSSISPKRFRDGRHSTSSVVHELDSTVKACWKTLTAHGKLPCVWMCLQLLPSVLGMSHSASLKLFILLVNCSASLWTIWPIYKPFA